MSRAPGGLRLHSPSTNIITLEAPVEYRLAGVNQGQANPRIGFSFASGLRSLFRGPGCRQCGGTGFSGTGQHLRVDGALRDGSKPDPPPCLRPSEVRAQAVSEGMRSMMDDGREKVLNGITSYEEVVRVAYQEE